MTLCDIQSARNFPLVIYGLKNGTIGALEATLSEDEAFILWEEDAS